VKSYLQRLIVLLFLAAMIMYSMWDLIPPKPSSQESSEEFSVQRTIAYLKAIAHEPHPTGSKANDRVRRFIFEASKDLGYQPHVQTAEISASAENRNLITAATINNVLVRVKGSSPSKALLVTAHYDSEAGSHGANDDGVAVAAMLETLRTLKEIGQLKNDVIFLFTDGEELGLLGAKAFWIEHPWAKDIGLVLNYEARGSSGPSLMFETGENNGWLIEQFSKASSHPISNSSMSDFYELMTNDTDFTVAKERGMTGLNFAYGDGRHAYHTPLDNLEHIDQRTVNHHGKNVYTLVKHFGNADLLNINKEDKIFFNLAGILIHYSSSWVIPLNSLISLLILCAVFWRVKEKRLKFYRLGWTLLLAPALLIFLFGMMLGTWKLLGLVWTEQMFRYQLDTIAIAFVFLSLALFILAYQVMTRWLDLDHFYPVILLYNLVLLWGTAFYLPGASYLLVWPFIIHYLFYFSTIKSTAPLESYTLLHTLASGLCLLFFVPMIYLLIIFLPLNVLPCIMAGVGLVASWILPSLALLMKNTSKYTPLSLFTLSLCALGWFHINVQHSPAIPQQNNLFYVQHADHEASYWVSKTKPDDWTKAFFPNPEVRSLNDMIIFNGTKQMVWTDQVKNEPLLEPKITVIKNVKIGDYRELVLHLDSGRKAQEYFMIEVIDAQVLSCLVQGHIPDYSTSSEEKWNWRMRYYNVPEEGIHIKLKVKGTNPISFRVMDGTYGLPFSGEQTERPQEMTGRYEYDQMSLVVKRFLIE